MSNESSQLPKSDRRIILMLAAIALFCIAVLLIMHNTGTRFQPQVNSESGAVKNLFNNGGGVSPLGNADRGSAVLSPFDPNTVDSATMAGFGLESWKVRNFLHYRAAGKVFRTPDDLLDTYGWEAADLEALRPYIHIAPQFRTRQRQNDYSRNYDAIPNRPSYAAERDSVAINRPCIEKFRTLTLVDVNTADTTLLQRIPGIGSYYSRSIVRLREKLGGLYSLEQLFEINNFPEQALEWLEVKTPQLRSINPNSADFKTLASHPYIGYDRTKLIQRRIRLYGPFRQAEELVAAGIFSDDELQPLIPYLTFE